MTLYPDEVIEGAYGGVIDLTKSPLGTAALVVPGKPGYLQDPPEVKQHAKRGDPPMDLPSPNAAPRASVLAAGRSKFSDAAAAPSDV